MSEEDDLRYLLGRALDEVWRLRRALAYEARVVEAHYEGYKSFPKTRRAIAEEQVARMRQAVTLPEVAYAGTSYLSLKRADSHVGPLTVHTWKSEVTDRHL